MNCVNPLQTRCYIHQIAYVILNFSKCQGCRAMPVGQRPPSFWQISQPYYNRGLQIMPTTLLLPPPPIFWTLRRLWLCNYSFAVTALTSLKRPQLVEARLTFATTSTVPAEAVKKTMSFANWCTRFGIICAPITTMNSGLRGRI